MFGLRTLTFTFFSILATALVACSDSDGTLEADQISCDTFANVESYRFSVDLMLDVPAFEDEPSQTADPLTAFADALTSLFADMQIQGAYSAPDRSQVIMSYEGREIEWRSIGDQAWVGFEDRWEPLADTESGDGLLTPEVVCDDIVLNIAHSLSDSQFETETVNEIETFHYSVDIDDLEELPPLLADPDLGDLPDDLTFDVWLAQDGLWPVRVNLESSDTDATGETVSLSLDMQVRDVNDEGILIDPPVSDDVD